MLLKIFLIAGLLFVFYQDLRYRAVYWVLFPVLLILLIFLAIKQQTLADLALNSGYNFAFLLIQFFLLFVYFSAKSRAIVNITSGYLGWGDILFLFCIACYLSPANYLIFYILSLVVVLIAVLVMYSLNRAKEIKVPLAGMQAALFAALLIADWRLDKINITNDNWLLNYFG